jgi:hypothetical protein
VSTSTQAPRLAAQQRGLLALLKERPAPVGADPYLELVRESRGLTMLRTISTWWRRFDLERQAPLTSRALAHAGRFEDAIAQLGRRSDTPTAIDALGMRFLEHHARDADPLIAAVASTERALTLAGRGDRSRHRIAWDRAPAPILNALLAGDAPGEAAPGDYCVVVSRDLPTLISVEQVDGRPR